jgi:hypothetical protein
MKVFQDTTEQSMAIDIHLSSLAENKRFGYSLKLMMRYLKSSFLWVS